MGPGLRSCRLVALALFLASCGVGFPVGGTAGNDSDGDGYPVPDDCDDEDATVHPAAEEVLDNDVDENCDESLDT